VIYQDLVELEKDGATVVTDNDARKYGTSDNHK
jgi:hypothetical protein